MKNFHNVLLVWLIALTLLGLSLLSLSMVSAASPEPSHSTCFVGSAASCNLIDDFNTGPDRMCYNSPGGSITCIIISNSLAMTYNVITPGTYAWLHEDLDDADLSAWNSVWIVIKGKKGGEQLYAEFTNCAPWLYSQKVKITDYLVEGITTTWHAVAIPFSAFTNSLNDDQKKNWSWSCIDRFTIVADNNLPNDSGTIYLDEIRLLPSVVLIDDFHDQESENELGGDSGEWHDSPATMMHTFPDDTLMLNYNAPIETDGSGYWTKLINTNLLSQKDYLFFDIHGQLGKEEIWVQLMDCFASSPSLRPEIKISDYLEDGITTTWRTVAIPLAAFVELSGNKGVNWNCIEQVTFNAKGRSLDGSNQGIVFIDNIKLIPASALPSRLAILVDRFHDCDDWNALSWEWNKGVVGMPVFTMTFNDPMNHSGHYSCGLRLTYDVEAGESAYMWTWLKGLNVKGYMYLEFYLKGKVGGEALHVYLAELASPIKQKFFPVEATDQWQRVRIPLSYFEDVVNLQRLQELKFAWEEGFHQGEVYIDDISFMEPSTITLPIVSKAALTELYVFNDNTGGALTFVVRDLLSKVEITSCVVPNNATLFCGKFPPGRYEVQAFTICSGGDPNPIAIRNYHSGPQTSEVFCRSN
jgi:hypothetical protein